MRQLRLSFHGRGRVRVSLLPQSSGSVSSVSVMPAPRKWVWPGRASGLQSPASARPRRQSSPGRDEPSWVGAEPIPVALELLGEAVPCDGGDPLGVSPLDLLGRLAAIGTTGRL